MPMHKFLADHIPLDTMFCADLQCDQYVGIKVYVQDVFLIFYYLFSRFEKNTLDARFP